VVVVVAQRFTGVFNPGVGEKLTRVPANADPNQRPFNSMGRQKPRKRDGSHEALRPYHAMPRRSH
jgi:hypothetical protein